MKLLEKYENSRKFMKLNPNLVPGANDKDVLEQAHNLSLEGRQLTDEQMNKFKTQFKLDEIA